MFYFRAFIDSGKLRTQMGNKVIQREDILEQHAPWLNADSVLIVD